MKSALDANRIENQEAALRQAAEQDFYNTSAFTLRDLRSVGNRSRLRQDFEAYLDGFSPNVQEILDNFEFRNQIPRLTKTDALDGLSRGPSTQNRTCPRGGWTTTAWARCSRSWCGASTRRTTRRPASTGRRVTRCA